MKSILILLLLSGISHGENDPDGKRLFRNAHIVNLMAMKGERVYAGPLTIFIHPETHKPVKSVVVDPKKNLLIPAIQKRAGGRNATSIYLVRAVSGRSRKALFRSIGGETHIVVPDDLGKTPIQKRTFWVNGNRNGKRFVRQIGFYEVIAYTSRDAFLNATLPMNAIDSVGWQDPGGPEKKAPAKGVEIGIEPVPPTKKGSRYKIRGTVSETGEVDGKLMIWIAYSEGIPENRRQEIDLEKGKGKKKKKEDDRPGERDPEEMTDQGFEFIVMAKSGPAERNVLKVAGISDEDADFSGKGNIRIAEWNPLLQFPGKVVECPEGFAPFNDGSGEAPGKKLFRQAAVAIGSASTGLVPMIFAFVDPESGQKTKTTRSGVVVHREDVDELVQVKVFFDELPPIDPVEGEKKDPRQIQPDLKFSVSGK